VDGIGVGWKRVDEVGAGEGVLGVASVDRVAGEDGIVAEVFITHTAEAAGAVCAAHPGDADSGADGELGGGAVDDFADDLVTGNNSRVTWRELTLHNMKISAADRTCEHTQQNVTWLWLWRGDIFDFQRRL